jgi:hypothetical protein
LSYLPQLKKQQIYPPFNTSNPVSKPTRPHTAALPAQKANQKQTPTNQKRGSKKLNEHDQSPSFTHSQGSKNPFQFFATRGRTKLLKPTDHRIWVLRHPTVRCPILLPPQLWLHVSRMSTLVLELNIQLMRFLLLLLLILFTLAPIIVRELAADPALDQTQHVCVAALIPRKGIRSTAAPQEARIVPLSLMECVSRLPIQTGRAKALAKLAPQPAVNDFRVQVTVIVNAKFHERWWTKTEGHTELLLPV